MKVINIAVRKDGKVEQDTLFTDKTINQKFADEIAFIYNCDVIISVIGSFKKHSEELIKSSTFVSDKKETLKND